MEINKISNFSKVLEILTDDKLKRNIELRLQDYWKCAGLPFDWIPLILNILKEYHFDKELAVSKVREKFPSIAHKNGLGYSKKLKNFRMEKVKNLVKRIENDITGEIIADIGGRADDLAEQIILSNSSIKKVNVTDIGIFTERSNNPKVEFIVQPSLKKILFDKESVDTAILSMVLHHLENKNQKDLLNSIISSLKKKGVIILIEDTYPEDYSTENLDEIMREYLRFNNDEKKKILFFYDWFGNKLMRNRDNLPIIFNYKTIEEWCKFFEDLGLQLIRKEFIKKDYSKPDLFPPKAIMVFRK